MHIMYVRTVRNASRRHQGSRGSTARLGSLEGEKAKKMRRIMRSRGRRRSVAGGGGSGGRNGGRIRRSRERKRRSATDLAVIKELPFKPIGLGVTSNLSQKKKKKFLRKIQKIYLCNIFFFLIQIIYQII
ncbi:hypothetical protein AtEden1_Chr2g0263371 [Arabidopsis thaliana]